MTAIKTAPTQNILLFIDSDYLFGIFNLFLLVIPKKLVEQYFFFALK